LGTLAIKASAGRASNGDVGTTDLQEGVIEANLGEPSVVALKRDSCALAELRKIERLALGDSDPVEGDGRAARCSRCNSTGTNGAGIGTVSTLDQHV